MNVIGIFAVISCFLFLVCGSDVNAHAAGQPPFFKVNGIYSPLYTVLSTSITDFALPQDQGPENYLVNQPIDFIIDRTQLAVPQDVFNQTGFTWDFGDGTTGTGSELSHTYSKPGSYLIVIDAQYQDVSGAQLFQSIMLNVLPDANYKLPKAVMAINGKTPADPLIDVINISFGQAVQFDASKSSGGGSKIVSYFWDFGDSKSGTGESVSHSYDTKLVQQQVFPVLRVKTADGFIADSFAEIDNKGGKMVGVGEASKKLVKSGRSYWFLAGVGILVIVGVIFFGKKRRKRG